MPFTRIRQRLFLIFATLLAFVAAGWAQEREFQVDLSQSSVKFTLGDVLHTVHGTFKVKRGALHIDPSGNISGVIVVDAQSGNSGNGMRDGKMHREVLESERYPEISFRPDRVESAVPASGNSSVKIHGIFNIHGVDREITVPAQIELSADHWTANVHFTVPYEKWGMKNPSTLFLRVSNSVEIDLVAVGTVASGAATSTQ
jgi:polyisoprenoid-binding protein YceI